MHAWVALRAESNAQRPDGAGLSPRLSVRRVCNPPESLRRISGAATPPSLAGGQGHDFGGHCTPGVRSVLNSQGPGAAPLFRSFQSHSVVLQCLMDQGPF